MATRKRKKTTRTKRTRLGSPVRTAPPGTARDRIKESWERVVKALGTTQANVEAGVRDLLRRNRISTKDAATLMADVRALANRERRKAGRELRTGLAALQTRVEKERRGAAKSLDDAVRSALAALNIPSRSEVAALTRKVDELSKALARKKR
jgi:polyhydroxyalkanoate synthesis regulator phasin